LNSQPSVTPAVCGEEDSIDRAVNRLGVTSVSISKPRDSRLDNLYTLQRTPLVIIYTRQRSTRKRPWEPEETHIMNILFWESSPGGGEAGTISTDSPPRHCGTIDTQRVEEFVIW